MKRPDDIMSQAEHAVWWETLTEDERRIAWIPDGHRFDLIFAALIKRALIDCKMTAGQRLKRLERLHSMANMHLPAEAIAVVEPASDTLARIVEEAMSLDTDDDRVASFRVLAGWEVFAGTIVKLEPSIMDAIRRSTNAANP